MTRFVLHVEPQNKHTLIMFDMISDVPVNYTVVIALSIVVCIMAAALISKRIAMKIKGPLFNPVLQHLNSEMDSNTAALDKRNARHEQMEKFASKIVSTSFSLWEHISLLHS